MVVLSDLTLLQLAFCLFLWSPYNQHFMISGTLPKLKNCNYMSGSLRTASNAFGVSFEIRDDSKSTCCTVRYEGHKMTRILNARFKSLHSELWPFQFKVLFEGKAALPQGKQFISWNIFLGYILRYGMLNLGVCYLESCLNTDITTHLHSKILFFPRHIQRQVSFYMISFCTISL
jgi:hypothetical protein